MNRAGSSAEVRAVPVATPPVDSDPSWVRSRFQQYLLLANNGMAERWMSRSMTSVYCGPEGRSQLAASTVLGSSGCADFGSATGPGRRGEFVSMIADHPLPQTVDPGFRFVRNGQADFLWERSRQYVP